MYKLNVRIFSYSLQEIFLLVMPTRCRAFRILYQ